MSVAAWIVLDDVAGDEHCIDRPVAGLRLREGVSERRRRLYAAQGFGFAAVEMRIGKLYETQHTHIGYDTQAPRAVRVVGKA